MTAETRQEQVKRRAQELFATGVVLALLRGQLGDVLFSAVPEIDDDGAIQPAVDVMISTVAPGRYRLSIERISDDD
jgi:hypothetical protein